MAKKIKFNATFFSIENCITQDANKDDIFPFSDVVDNLVANSNNAFIVNKIPRRLFFDTTDPDFIKGLALSFKSEKSIMTTIKNSESNYKFDVHVIGEDADITEFNYFVICKKKQICLYQTLHGGFALGSFNGYLCESRKQMVEKYAIDSSSNVSDPNKKHKAYNRHKKGCGKIVPSPYYSKDGIEALINKLGRLRSFKFNLRTFNINTTSINTKEFVNSHHNEIIFDSKAKHVKPSSLELVNVLKKTMNFEKGRFTIDDLDGDPLTLYLDENVHEFFSLDYDSVTSKIDQIDTSQIANSWVVKRLMKIIEKKSHIFGDLD